MVDADWVEPSRWCPKCGADASEVVEYLEAVAYGEDGEAAGQHVVPYSLVRSASARPIQPATEETPNAES